MGAIKKMTTRKSEKKIGYHGPLIIRRDEAPPASKHPGKEVKSKPLRSSTITRKSTHCMAKPPNNKTSYSHMPMPLITILILNISRQP